MIHKSIVRIYLKRINSIVFVIYFNFKAYLHLWWQSNKKLNLQNDVFFPSNLCALWKEPKFYQMIICPCIIKHSLISANWYRFFFIESYNFYYKTAVEHIFHCEILMIDWIPWKCAVCFSCFIWGILHHKFNCSL